MTIVNSVEQHAAIEGVYVVSLREFPDERGRFVESWRRDWVPGSREMLQSNRSDSVAGTLRGMHYHLFQADYWYLVSGSAVAGLYDLRESSPTKGASTTIELDGVGLYIPPGVAHGFFATTDATLTYLVDQYYDGSDELGFRFDDRAMSIVWPSNPSFISARDRANPPIAEIPPENLPA